MPQKCQERTEAECGRIGAYLPGAELRQSVLSPDPSKPR